MNAEGQVFGSEDDHLLQRPTDTAGEVVTPLLIDDAAAWSACFVVHDEDYPLASYIYWEASGDPRVIELQCGYHSTANDTGHGWHHISYQHESQWRDRITQLATGDPTGAGWDDLMSFVNDAVIGWPEVDVPRASNSTRCVGAPVLMYDADGTYEYTFYPSVIFGTDSNRVITSIPGSSYSC